ncbi:hypothetical protein ACFU99_08560, partial [Streptomyces sp. NPDC057654]|uniref:hypothetical protein n=1 Tax=Streptomyces sp. NPDC057654 TaxID=3346196 RepID=UPI0036C59F86
MTGDDGVRRRIPAWRGRARAPTAAGARRPTGRSRQRCFAVFAAVFVAFVANTLENWFQRAVSHP